VTPYSLADEHRCSEGMCGFRRQGVREVKAAFYCRNVGNGLPDRAVLEPKDRFVNSHLCENVNFGITV